jgi:hypothetical protein
MKKLPSKTLFQGIAAGDPVKVASLKMKIAAGEYRIDPQDIAEKLMATDAFFSIYKSFTLSRSWHFKPGSF